MYFFLDILEYMYMNCVVNIISMEKYKIKKKQNLTTNESFAYPNIGSSSKSPINEPNRDIFFRY